MKDVFGNVFSIEHKSDMNADCYIGIAQVNAYICKGDRTYNF